MVMPEILKGKKLAKRKEFIKAKRMTAGQRDDMTFSFLKKFDYHKKIETILTLLFFKIKKKDERFMDYIYKIIDMFSSIEKTRFILLCRNSIKQFEEKEKLKDIQKENLDHYKKMMEYAKEKQQ